MFARDAFMFKKTGYQQESRMEPTGKETREAQRTEEDERRRSSRVRRPVYRYNGINEIESGEEMLEARRRVQQTNRLFLLFYETVFSLSKFTIDIYFLRLREQIIISFLIFNIFFISFSL